jgi:hypothetical protein
MALRAARTDETHNPNAVICCQIVLVLFYLMKYLPTPPHPAECRNLVAHYTRYASQMMQPTHGPRILGPVKATIAPENVVLFHRQANNDHLGAQMALYANEQVADQMAPDATRCHAILWRRLDD